MIIIFQVSVCQAYFDIGVELQYGYRFQNYFFFNNNRKVGQHRFLPTVWSVFLKELIHKFTISQLFVYQHKEKIHVIANTLHYYPKANLNTSGQQYLVSWDMSLFTYEITTGETLQPFFVIV